MKRTNGGKWTNLQARMQAAKRQRLLRLRGIGVTKVRVQVREKVSMLPGPAIPRHTVASNKPTVTRWMRRIKSAIRSSPLSAAVVVGNFHRDRDYERTNERGVVDRRVSCQGHVLCWLIFAIVRRPPNECQAAGRGIQTRGGAEPSCNSFLQCTSWISWRRTGMKKCSD